MAAFFDGFQNNLIRKNKDSPFWRKYFGSAIMKREVRIEFYKTIGEYQKMGMTPSEALSQYQIIMTRDGRRPHDPVAFLCAIWNEAVLNGDSLGEAVEGWVPHAESSILKVSGQADLPRATRNLETLFVASKKMRRSIINGTAMPVFSLYMLAGVFIAFHVYGTPIFSSQLPLSKWPAPPLIIDSVGNFFWNYWILTLVMPVVIFMLAAYSLPRLTGRIRLFLDFFPPWSIYKIVSGASFMLSLAAMRAVGMTNGDAMTAIAGDASPWLKDILDRARAEMTNAQGNIGAALLAVGANFPDEVTVLNLRSFSPMPTFSETIEATAGAWLENAVLKLADRMKIINTAMGILVGGVIIFGLIGLIMLGMAGN